MSEIIQYRTQGTCCRLMQVKINDNMVDDVEFVGGCNGNLQGIRSLIKGMPVETVIEKLRGIPCGDKKTSCPDQLAQCLIAYKNGVVANY